MIGQRAPSRPAARRPASLARCIAGAPRRHRCAPRIAFAAPLPLAATFLSCALPRVTKRRSRTSALRAARLIAVRASAEAPARRAKGELYVPDGSGGVVGKWPIVLAAGVVHAVHIAAIYLGPTTLMSPMRAELGLSITQIALPLNVFRAVNAVLLIPAGALLDRYGVFRALWPSMVGAAAFGLLLPVANSLTHLTLLQAVLALTKLFGGLTSMLMVVGAAFGTSRSGTAAAVILSGYSLAGCVAPAVIGVLSSRFGWRVAMAVLNGAFLVVGIPLSYMYLRFPFGEARAPPAAKVKDAAAEPLFSRRYVSALVMMALLSVSIHVVLDHLVIFMREDVGFSFELCTLLMSVLNLCALIAKMGAGWLSDRFDRGALFVACAAISVASCFLLLGVTPAGTLVLAASRARLFAFAVLCKCAPCS